MRSSSELLRAIQENRERERQRILGLFPKYKPFKHYLDLLEEPTVKARGLAGSLLRHNVAEANPDYVRVPEIREDLAHLSGALKLYLEAKPHIHEMTDKELHDTLTPTRMNLMGYEPAFNNIVITSEKLKQLTHNPGLIDTDPAFRAILHSGFKDTAVPIFITKNDMRGEASGHAMTILRHGKDIEMYDPSALGPAAFKPEVTNALVFLGRALIQKTGGSFIRNNIIMNTSGICDRYSCLRAHHKDLPLDEFQKRFVARDTANRILPEQTQININKEYVAEGLPETTLLGAIKTYEPHAEAHERNAMAAEDALSHAIRKALKK